MRNRLRQLVSIVAAVAIPILVAVGAGAAAVYLTGPSGSISCVSPPPPNAEPIQRWLVVAGVPALIAGLVGAFFALGAGRVLWQLVGLVLSVALAGVTFYVVYTLLPADCRT
jgi:hypothetical protein